MSVLVLAKYVVLRGLGLHECRATKKMIRYCHTRKSALLEDHQVRHPSLMYRVHLMYRRLLLMLRVAPASVEVTSQVTSNAALRLSSVKRVSGKLPFPALLTECLAFTQLKNRGLDNLLFNKHPLWVEYVFLFMSHVGVLMKHATRCNILYYVTS